jgi:hypothetical protein
MKSAKKKPIAANLRSWRVIIMHSRGEYLGSVEAPDRERAEAVAIKQFDLGHDQRRRLLIRERLLASFFSAKLDVPEGPGKMKAPAQSLGAPGLGLGFTFKQIGAYVPIRFR